jgi:hypothetical protein
LFGVSLVVHFYNSTGLAAPRPPETGIAGLKLNVRILAMRHEARDFDHRNCTLKSQLLGARKRCLGRCAPGQRRIFGGHRKRQPTQTRPSENCFATRQQTKLKLLFQ